MGTSSSTQRDSQALPQDTAPKTPPTPKRQLMFSTEEALRVLTLLYGSSYGDQTPGMLRSLKGKSLDFNIVTWVNGRSKTPVATPSKPTETTSSGKSGW